MFSLRVSNIDFYFLYKGFWMVNIIDIICFNVIYLDKSFVIGIKNRLGLIIMYVYLSL